MIQPQISGQETEWHPLHVKNEPDDSRILSQMSGHETRTHVKCEQNDSIIQPQLLDQDTHWNLEQVKSELNDINQTHMSGQETGSGLEYVKGEPDVADSQVSEQRIKFSDAQLLDTDYMNGGKREAGKAQIFPKIQKVGCKSDGREDGKRESKDYMLVTEDMKCQPKDYMLVTEDVKCEPKDYMLVTEDGKCELKDCMPVTDDVKCESDDCMHITEDVKCELGDCMRVTEDVKCESDKCMHNKEKVKYEDDDTMPGTEEMGCTPDGTMCTGDRQYQKSDSTTIYRKTCTQITAYQDENRFSEQNNLTCHMMSHTVDNVYNSEVCDKGFAQQSDMSKHMRTHTGERPYTCNVCGNGFFQKCSFMQKRNLTSVMYVVRDLLDQVV